MRNIATCYSEHAVRVSDSYCSGPLNKSYVSPNSIPAAQSAVSQTFKANIDGEKRLLVTVTWCSKLICQGFFLKLSRANHPTATGSHHRQMGKPKGSKRVGFEENGSDNVQVYWDLSSARFESGPEPLGSFYIVILLADSQTALFLGDMEDKPNVRNLVNGYDIRTLSLVSQYEHFNGQGSNPISTRVRFGGSGSEHEIMIKCGPEEDGPRSPVLSISIDKKRVVRVKRLQWNFRGNQVIFVDGLLVDVMWDVFGWFLDHQNGKNNSNSGLFMFRTRSGLDSRLWLEEEEKKFAHQNQNHDKPEFSLLISASSKNPG